MKRGDVETDANGTRWVIVGVNVGGFSGVSRVQEGSLAHQIIFPEHFVGE